MAEKEQNFEMWQGATRTLQITVTGTDLPSASAAKWALANTAGAIVLTKTLAAGGITRADQVASVLLYPSDTAALPPGDYAHELRLTDAAAQDDVVTTGTLTLHPSYTK